MSTLQSDDWSGIATIIYLTMNVLFTLCLAGVIYWHQHHKLDQQFTKAVWQQRTIYGQALVHFYDTSTDLGVIITWYYLYQDEKNGLNYESVDMKLFFFSACGVIVLYRICALLLCKYDLNTYGRTNGVCATVGLYFLALMDMYIFVAIYDSFKSAGDVIKQNEDRRLRKKQRIAELKKQRLEEFRQAQQEMTEKAAESAGWKKKKKKK
eukprot:6024_1